MAAGVASASACESGSMFSTGIMPGVSYVTLAVPCFIGMEMVECPLAALGHRSGVTVTRVVTVIDMAVEAAMTVEPWAGSDEDAANEPVRPVIAVGSARVGRVVEVSVRAHRRDPDVHRDLSWSGWTAGEEHSRSNDQ